MPISGWFMVYNEREWSGDRRRMCISRHRQLCVLFVFIFYYFVGCYYFTCIEAAQF